MKKYIKYMTPEEIIKRLNDGEMRFYKDGDIYINIGCLRGKRTAEQIKAIITNLL